MQRIAFDRVRVLVAIADGALRERVRATLEAYGCRDVLDAADGFEALDIFAATSIDIVVAECEMPLVDGIELTRLIRLTERTGGPAGNPYAPVLLVGEFSSRTALKAALDAGVTEALPADRLTPALLFDALSGVIADPRPFIHSADYFGPDRRQVDRGSTGATPLVTVEDTGVGEVTQEAFPDHVIHRAENLLGARAIVEDDAEEMSREAALARADRALEALAVAHRDQLRADAERLHDAFRAFEASPGRSSCRASLLEAAHAAYLNAKRHGFRTAAHIAGELHELLWSVHVDAGSLRVVGCHVEALRAAASRPEDDTRVAGLVDQLAQLGAQMRRRAAAMGALAIA